MQTRDIQRDIRKADGGEMSKVRRPKKAYSEKEIEKIKRRYNQLGMEATLLLIYMVLAEDYNFTEDQIIELAERTNGGKKYIENGWVKLRDVADIIEKHTGMKFELLARGDRK